MAAETVKIYVVDQDADPVVGVLVRFFDATGTTFITQQVTSLVGSDAVAEVTLEGDDPAIGYTIRLSKTGVAFDGSLGSSSKSPQLISVASPPDPLNEWDVLAVTFSRPTATNPRLCRCSGFFLDIAGRPLVNMDISFINTFAPAVVDGSAVMGPEIQVRTDEDGYVELDLYRNGIYDAWVPGVCAREDADGNTAIAFPRTVKVPDSSSANLPDLLFPVVEAVDFGVASLSLEVLEQGSLTPVVTASDGRTLIGAALEDVIYMIDDLSIAGISTSATQVFVVGAAPGTTVLRATRKDLSVVKIPNAEITGQPLTITVT
jgi:hypothetical protein